MLPALDQLTHGEYTRKLKHNFSAASRENLDGIDWRVPRLLYCKDPKFNEGLDPRFAFEVQQRKAADARTLEQQLGTEAMAIWEQRLADGNVSPEERPQFLPPQERTVRRGVPFVEAVPNYTREDDVWSRRLELRSLDEALHGDVSQPMPRPVVFEEDYENFRAGKYVKPDCPIA